MAETKRPLMFEQREEEHLRSMLWRQPPWIHDRPPPGTGTYLASCITADGRKYVALKYWSVPEKGTQFDRGPHWVDAGPYVTVQAWAPEPLVWDGVQREQSRELAV